MTGVVEAAVADASGVVLGAEVVGASAEVVAAAIRRAGVVGTAAIRGTAIVRAIAGTIGDTTVTYARAR
jgi:hypothetical protein